MSDGPQSPTGIAQSFASARWCKTHPSLRRCISPNSRMAAAAAGGYTRPKEGAARAPQMWNTRTYGSAVSSGQLAFLRSRNGVRMNSMVSERVSTQYRDSCGPPLTSFRSTRRFFICSAVCDGLSAVLQISSCRDWARRSTSEGGIASERVPLCH